MVKIKAVNLQVVWTDGVEETMRVPEWAMSNLDMFLDDLEENKNFTIAETNFYKNRLQVKTLEGTNE
jgi:hypothetical protein